MLSKFIVIIFVLAINGRFDELKTFLELIPQIINIPDDSEELKNLAASLKGGDDRLAASVAANQP